MNREKIIDKLLTFSGVAILLGVLWFILNKIFNKDPKKEVVEAASGELKERIKQGKIVTLSDFDSKALADRFAVLFNWKYSVFGATAKEIEKELNKIKTYGDYLKVVEAYGVRDHAVYGHSGGLDYGAHENTSELAQVYWDAYVKQLKANNK